MPIPFVKDIDFEYGKAQSVSPLVRRLIARNPGPFTYTGTGVYIIGEGDVAVIDPGPVLDEHEAALDAALEGERVSAVLVTHHHLDHSPLAHPLARKHGAPVYGRAAPERHRPLSGDQPVTEEGADAAFTPDIDLQDGQTISGPGWTLEAIATPGHTSNHVCFGFAEEAACFTGDHVMGWSTSVVVPPDGNMNAYLESLQRIRAREFETLWPTHGPPITRPDRFLRAYIGHRLQREKQIREQVAQGRTTPEDIVPKLYSGVDKRLWPAAAMSVKAHLERLKENGEI